MNERERSVRAAIRGYLTSLGRGSVLADREDLVRAGVVNSLLLLDLVGFLEESFGVRVQPRDVFERRLATVDGMVSLVLDRAA